MEKNDLSYASTPTSSQSPILESKRDQKTLVLDSEVHVYYRRKRHRE